MQKDPKPWMKQPGELHDMNGVPIYPGDLLKSYHFTGPRRKRYYLYHTAYLHVDAEGYACMRMKPTCHLEPTKVKGGGECLMSQDLLTETEVIYGSGPGNCLDYTDRPKIVIA